MGEVRRRLLTLAGVRGTGSYLSGGSGEGVIAVNCMESGGFRLRGS